MTISLFLLSVVFIGAGIFLYVTRKENSSSLVGRKRCLKAIVTLGLMGMLFFMAGLKQSNSVDAQGLPDKLEESYSVVNVTNMHKEHKVQVQLSTGAVKEYKKDAVDFQENINKNQTGTVLKVYKTSQGSLKYVLTLGLK